MWGDPIGAAALNQPVVNVDNNNNNTNNDTSPNSNSNKNTKTTINTENLNKNQKKCLSSIYQITGPAHIPTSDIRWQELFLSYDILVHLDRGHIHDCSSNGNSNSNRNMTMMDQVCHSMAKHARNSSNLAGFAWHLTKMMNEFMTSCKECSNYNSNSNADISSASGTRTSAPESASPTPVPTSSSSMGQSQNRNANANSHTYTNAATAKIAMVGKARVVCGILNLFRIICHEVIIASLADVDTDTSTNNNTSGNVTGTGAVGSSSTSTFTSTSTSSYEFLQETFTYKSRQKESEGLDMDTSAQLLSTLLSFISMMGSNNGTNNNMDDLRGNGDDNVNGHGNGNGANRAYSCMQLLNTVPELYDATVLSLMLISVLYSTQLYQPLLSSFELRDELYNNHNNTNNNGHIHGHHGHGDTNQNGNHNHNTSTAAIHRNFFLDHTMQQAYEKRQKINNTNQNQNNYHHYTPSYNIHTWSSQSILSSCLNWIIQRPSPPERSIAAHFRDMVDTVAHDVKNEKVGSDGMFENHAIVMSRAPLLDDEKVGDDGKESEKNGGNGSSSRGKNGRGDRRGRLRRHRSAPMVILDATNKVIHLSSSLLMLPFRLMTLALRALGHPESFLLGGSKGSGEGFDDIKLAQLQAAYGARGGGSDSIASPTNDVLWLSDSPIADLGNTLFLILSNNYRASSHSDTGGAGDCSADYYFINNAFRSELASLDDNRWDGWKSSGYSVNENTYLEDASSAFESVDLGSNGGTNGSENNSLLSSSKNPKQKRLLTTNFEHLFQSFGGTLHNELGALTLYTLLQSSPIFTASLAVRTDLDMLVLPLLRTLYFSSSVNHHIAGRTTTSSAKKTPNGKAIANSSSSVQVSENPFRSQSQLYVIMILLLIFSQDTSFGPDSFRRSNISVVVWYKERSLKNISLGSMIVLSLLRSITFNLNRMQDPFLLSNCCAVLLNLSPHIVNLHSYASMRLASVLLSSMKRYTVLVMKNGGKPAEEGDVSSLLGMYAETCRILLQVVKHCIRRRVVEKNLHLVYSLVYNQRDLNTVLKAKKSPFKPSDTEKITALIKKADTLIENSSARTAEKTMEVLEKSTGFLKGSKSSGKSNARMISSSASTTDESTISTSSSTVSGMEDFRFTYEEEADPEIFFVPYLWEIVVSCVSASTLEWNKRRIKVFALLEHAGEDIQDSAGDSNTISGVYGKDVEDLV